MLKIAIGTDHRGVDHKNYVIKTLCDHNWIDVGTHSHDRVDYPLYAHAAISVLLQKKAQYAVLVCASGTGMAIAANRYSYMYAAVAWNTVVARQAREEDNINIIALPADFISPQEAVEIVKIFLSTSFKYGRYQQRLDMIDTKK